MDDEEVSKSPAIFVQVERKNQQQSHEIPTEEAHGGVLTTDLYVSDASMVATVKLEFPDTQVLTQAWKITSHIALIKRHLAHWLQVPEARLLLYCEGVVIEDHQSLTSLGVKPHGTVLLQVRSASEEFPIIVPSSTMLHLPLLDVITVRVTNNGNSQDLVVEIENANIPKPFFGGFLKKSTQIEFHHAQTQTVLTVQDNVLLNYIDKAPSMVSKSTATYVERSTQRNQDVQTQVCRFSLMSNEFTGRILVAKRYTPFEEQNKAAKIIQRQFRHYVTRRPESRLKTDASTNASEEGKKTNSENELSGPHQQSHISWDLSQQIRRPNMRFVPPKIDLNQTVTFNDLQRLGVIKSKKVREKMLCQVLDKAAVPQTWTLTNGEIINVDTPQIEHNRQLQSVYQKLSNESKDVSRPERMELLFLLKRIVSGDASTMAKDLVKLADREMDFIIRGATTAAVNALRTRMTTLFRRYLQQHMDV